MRQSFNDFFDDFFAFPSISEKPLLGDFNKYAVATMKTDIVKNDDNYELNVEIPGVKKEDVEITLEDGVLTVSVEQVKEDNKESKNYVRKERYVGKQSRSFRVSDNITPEQIEASFDNGILKVVVPVVEPEVPEKKKISIK